MGYDLFGHKPKSEQGEYFRASIWSWPSIHMLIADTGVLNSDELEGILYNDGQVISKEKSLLIAASIEARINEYEEGFEFVNLDSPIAKMGDELLKAFVGQGVTIQNNTSRFVDLPYIKEFIDFCRDSGGFEVL